MNKREAILFLEKKRDKAIGDMSFFGEGSRKGLMNEIRVNTYDIAINTLEQIDDPQSEKVEVPDYVVEWYEEHKYDLDNSIWACVSSITQFHSREIELNDFEKWFSDFNNEPIETLIRMKDGYTVKPKRWVVKNKKHGSGLESFINGTVKPMWTTEEPLWMTFTDKSKAEAVATLVEGSVEEV